MLLSVIIPIKISELHRLVDAKECFKNLVSKNDPNFEIIIVDDSDDEIFNELDNWFCDTPVIHYKLDNKYRTGLNNKLNSIHSSLEVATGDYILLLDDDCRPKIETLVSVMQQLSKFDCMRFMADYQNPTIIDLVNTCGVFIINLVSTHKQFWGNLAFHRLTLIQLGFPDKNILFDELAIDLQFRRNRKKMGYISSIFIPMIQNSGFNKFLEQRVRYAYENIAYPIRYFLFLAIIPLLFFISFLSNGIAFLISLIIIITIFVTGIGLIGQLKYSKDHFPWYTFLLSPVWFWFYPFTSWIALFCYLKGGIFFGGTKIKRPV